MANLVGISSIGAYTNPVGANGQSGTRIIHNDFVASATGTATHLFFYARANNTPNVKLCIYSNAGALLGSTGSILITEGWNSAALGASVSIVSSTSYKLGWYADAGATDYWSDLSGDAYQDTGSGSYTTPASSITSTLDTGIDNFAMYADGTVGGGDDPVLGRRIYVMP